MHLGDNFCGKALPLHAGHRQDLAQLWLQPANPLFDHPLYPRRHRLPGQCWPLDPPRVLVLNQIPPFLHRPQQLDGEKRVSTGLPEQCLAEPFTQPVGLGIQKSIHESPALGLLSFSQIYPDVPEGALELAQHLFQRMALAVPAQGYLFRPIGSHQQEWAASKMPTQVEEQSDGGDIGPL